MTNVCPTDNTSLHDSQWHHKAFRAYRHMSMPQVRDRGERFTSTFPFFVTCPWRIQAITGIYCNSNGFAFILLHCVNIVRLSPPVWEFLPQNTISRDKPTHLELRDLSAAQCLSVCVYDLCSSIRWRVCVRFTVKVHTHTQLYLCTCHHSSTDHFISLLYPKFLGINIR